jgi:hypothetical protein
MRVTLWSDDEHPDGTTAAFAVNVLRELGYRATLHTTSHTAMVQASNRSRLGTQVGDAMWQADHPFASDFFDPLFRSSDSGSRSRRHEERLPLLRTRRRPANEPGRQRANNRRRKRRGNVGSRRPGGVTYAAPWVIRANINRVDFRSTRVTSYQYNPFLGLLVDQLQVSRRARAPKSHPPVLGRSATSSQTPTHSKTHSGRP